MRWLLMPVFCLMVATAQSPADGRMYWGDKVPPTIPYQRSLILFKDGIETLILQSRYQLPESKSAVSMGWVVPVPAVPEVASLRADSASRMFHELSNITYPRVTRVSNLIFIFVFFGFGGLLLLTLLVCMVSLPGFLPACIRRNRERLVCYSLGGVTICLYMALIFNALGYAGRSSGVDVIAEHRVGIYDVTVLRSDKADELIDWLNDNAFHYGPEDRAVIESYLSNKWCFVVAHIRPEVKPYDRTTQDDGLVAPLILRFPHVKPVYPLMLTGTGGHETEILIYILANSEMTTDERLSLRYSGEGDVAELARLSLDVEPAGFFKSDDWYFYHLCKFRDVLSPTDMVRDISFNPVSDSASFREHLIRW